MELALVKHLKRTNVALLAAVCVAVAPTRCLAITLGQIDDFQDGTTQGWGFGFGGSSPVDNAADAGPDGAGDHALFMDSDSGRHGVGRLLVINTVQWTGDWTAAGVEQVALDVRNPNAFPLSMRLGIAGPGGVFQAGQGDTYVTPAMTVPPDDAWHSITFDVLANDFSSIGGEDIDAALADVTHVRILNNPALSFIGEFGGAFYLDNIRPLGATAAVAGDYNGNGVVDAADYTVWRDTLGETGPGLAADGTGNMQVDQGDYDFWKARFGNTAASAAVAVVPEPAGLLLAAIALPLALLLRPKGERSTARR